MLWERPKTLRMMFLLQNLARIDAKNNIEGLRTPKASTVRIRISTLDYSQEIRAKSPSRKISKIKKTATES